MCVGRCSTLCLPMVQGYGFILVGGSTPPYPAIDRHVSLAEPLTVFLVLSKQTRHRRAYNYENSYFKGTDIDVPIVYVYVYVGGVIGTAYR